MNTNKRILVTGGAGYIGSHTLVDLIENNFEVICIDNFSRSTETMLHGVEKITGQKIKNYKIDLCDEAAVKKVFQEEKNIHGIIHFAAYKAVGESVENPLMYYSNNLKSLIHILQCAEENEVKQFVFSSSCSVYGNVEKLPVTEETPLGQSESPYATTKQMGEQIILDMAKVSNMSFVLLRYFNPVGAHPSTLIGELPIGKPNNLVPVITQTAIGLLPNMYVWGGDYNTRDGSCIRDYIHVCDIAHAHTLALHTLSVSDQNLKIYNIGTGNGVSVLEAIKAFEHVSGKRLNYTIGERRSGDVVEIFADNTKIQNELGWLPKYSLHQMMESAWAWQKKLK
ncbi:MAG: UDP-glucose 4-epimerase GalE [Chitinophagaceae bacterium]